MDSGNQYEQDGCFAELGAFDNYYYNMQMYLNPSTMQAKFISVGLIDGSGGGGVFLPDHIKMENMLQQVRNSIALNGPKYFGLLIQALRSVPAYQNLATEINSKSIPGSLVIQHMFSYHLGKYMELKSQKYQTDIDKNIAKGKYNNLKRTLPICM